MSNGYIVLSRQSGLFSELQSVANNIAASAVDSFSDVEIWAR